MHLDCSERSATRIVHHSIADILAIQASGSEEDLSAPLAEVDTKLSILRLCPDLHVENFRKLASSLTKEILSLAAMLSFSRPCLSYIP